MIELNKYCIRVVDDGFLVSNPALRDDVLVSSLRVEDRGYHRVDEQLASFIQGEEIPREIERPAKNLFKIVTEEIAVVVGVDSVSVKDSLLVVGVEMSDGEVVELYGEYRWVVEEELSPVFECPECGKEQSGCGYYTSFRVCYCPDCAIEYTQDISPVAEDVHYCTECEEYHPAFTVDSEFEAKETTLGGYEYEFSCKCGFVKDGRSITIGEPFDCKCGRTYTLSINKE